MKRLTIADIYRYKQEKKKISVITCYDYTTASILAETGIDMLMVGDSAAQVMLGCDNTLPATMDYMTLITEAVSRGAPNKLIAADMPFLSYQGSIKDAITNAGRFVAQAGADIVKFEVTEKQLDIVEAVSDAGIAVMAHIGMLPQSISLTGRLKAQATTADRRSQLLQTAKDMEQAGAKMLLLEGVATEAAAEAAQNTDLPVISCGAGAGCDGQVLVISDVLGLNKGFRPKFARKYADIGSEISGAIERYNKDVKDGSYPTEAESYHQKKQ